MSSSRRRSQHSKSSTQNTDFDYADEYDFDEDENDPDEHVPKRIGKRKRHKKNDGTAGSE